MCCAALWILWAVPALAQVAILQIRVVAGDGGVHQPGARTVRAITVEITEETGKPVPGAAVSFHLPEDGPGGLFLNGLRTEVILTDAQGHATLHGFLPNRTPGRFQIRILASKEQARAGTVSFQYIAEFRNGVPTASAPASPTRRKWIAVAAAVAGGAVVAVVASGHTSATPAAPTPPIPIPPAISLSIGTPTISVGKP